MSQRNSSARADGSTCSPGFRECPQDRSRRHRIPQAPLSRKRPAPSHPADDEAVEVRPSLHPARHGGARRSHRASPPGSYPAAPTCRGVVTAGTGLEQVQRMSPSGQEGRCETDEAENPSVFSNEGAGVFRQLERHGYIRLVLQRDLKPYRDALARTERRGRQEVQRIDPNQAVFTPRQLAKHASNPVLQLHDADVFQRRRSSHGNFH